MALEVPLALNLERRAVAELQTQALVQAQTVASSIPDELDETRTLRRLVERFARDPEGNEVRRVIVVDEDGTLLADSAGVGLIGENYATSERPEIVAALRDRVSDTRVEESETLGQEILATAVPVVSEGELRGAVRISEGMEPVRAGVRRAIAGLVVVGLAALLAGVVIAFIVAGALARPLGRLGGAAQRLGAGDLETRAGEVGGPREIEDLAHTFDDMAARLQNIVHAQRQFAANASHQLRTPLTGLKLRLEAARSKATDPTLERDLKAADGEVDRLAGIVQRLMVLAHRSETDDAQAVAIDDAARRAARRWQERAERAGATLAVAGDGAAARCDPGDVDQILDNLIHNAISYAPGSISIEVGRTDEWTTVAVADRGPGADPSDLEHLTERFYRGNNAPRGGSGLGLAIVAELARTWGGDVKIRNEHPGMRVEVRLPAA